MLERHANLLIIALEGLRRAAGIRLRQVGDPQRCLRSRGGHYRGWARQRARGQPYAGARGSASPRGRGPGSALPEEGRGREDRMDAAITEHEKIIETLRGDDEDVFCAAVNDHLQWSIVLARESR